MTETPVPTDTPDTPSTNEGRPWVTLKEAASASGMSVSGIRKWRSKGLIESKMEQGSTGRIVLVPLDDVLARAKRSRTTSTPTGTTTAMVPWAEYERLQESLREAQTQYLDEAKRATEMEQRAEYRGQRADELREELDRIRARLEVVEDAAGWVTRRRIRRRRPSE